MAPKNKGKKAQKANNDDYWQISSRENAGESVVNNKVEPPSDDDQPSRSNSGISAFAALQVEDGDAVQEEEDFGGLMSAIKASTNKPKKDKKKAKKDQALVEHSDTDTTSKQATAVTADDFDDDEWGPSKGKGKKAKKGTGGQDKAAEQLTENAETRPATPKPSDSIAAPNVETDEIADEEAGEAKKKAQAAAKKVNTADPVPAAPEERPVPADTVADENEGEADEGGKVESKNKKKKKKAKKDDEPPPPPPAATTKKKGGISALKAMMEEKKRLEEEAKRAEEAERRRIEEEERLAEEEARRKEEEKQRKKEKEKAKRELAKKEGRLLTKKQKEEKAAAEIRKQALLASGVQIEGLQQTSGVPTKKVVYSNRKKKGPAVNGASPASSRPRTPESAVVQEEKPEAISAPATNTVNGEEALAKDDWDASTDEETKLTPEVKDSWDASSDEETEPKPAHVPAPKLSTGKATLKLIPDTPKQVDAEPGPVAPVVKPVGKVAPVSKTTDSNAKPSDDEDSAADSSSNDELSEDESSEEESSEDESGSDEESSEEERSTAQRLAAQRKAEAAARRAKAHEAALAARSKDDLRSPICCILGHVDTGKTKLLDKIRQTNVQEGEAGGITQQIGATYFPVEAIKTKTAVMNKDGAQEYKIPGLLVIDTPGHESFTNLRSRGSSLCNIAILVVDIMHGLEAQTLESLRLLRDRKTPFIVALNKIDRLYGWQPTPDGAFQESLAKQTRAVQREFEDRVAKTIVAFAEEGLNAILYYDNKNFARNVSLVPTSAITGEGVPDMIMLLVNLTQQRMSDRLMYLSELECTVLEVKVIEGLGTTIDVVLSNGILHEGDKIVVCGLNGPIVTQIRALLTPQPLRELRIKSAYVHHKEVKAALGIKITAPDLEKAIAGSRLLVCGPDDDEDDLKEEVMSDLATLLNSIDKSGRGVCVQASTLGSLEALLDFLKSSKIPVSGINIGPVHKKDVMRAATMLEKARELACILCFDVQVDKDAERMAEEMGIRLFKADIIYHLFDKFTAYNQEITEAKRRDAAPQAIWPCRLKIIAAFCKRDPIILGVDILDGTLRVGTPIAVVKVDPTTQKREVIDLGKVTSLEINHKSMDIVKKSQAGGGVAVKIEHAVYQSAKMFGRHFDDKDELLSHITRQSIDVLKSSFRTDVSNEEWLLIKALKLQNLGYTQKLHRSWHLVENFAASFCALNFIGGVRSAIFLGLLAGGPAAIWSSYIITVVFMMITAAVLAEICSALPLSGSIYIWAAESAGPKYARFFGFVVAWWACTAWMTFTASNCQATANYIVSQLSVWEIDFPGGNGNSNVKWRALVLFTAGTMTGFDASGHIAEETQHASVVASKGILTSALATGVLGFFTTILFLFCTPDLDTLFSLNAPQPFVQIYVIALGRGASVFMTIIAVIGLILNTSVAIIAASRLVFAVARDGVLPFSAWIGQVTVEGQPRNAVTVIYIFSSLILCTILPSTVAFTSLVSAAAVPTIASYGLIALLRFTMTPDDFRSSRFCLGRFAKFFYACAFLFNGLVFAVMISPFYFPVDAKSFNFACVIFGAVTIFGIFSWCIIPEEKWLPREQILQALSITNEE
ncbi:hypothetical protein DFJ43DRAFT_1148879 [Lentinula guzmanii]|uniref:Eukaryotic translation initiation factor 5B n=1 Tax=Lentinula guzmanii TaxID=2804957 RepID=A0AA38JWQ9_9AGAR|nr:hypothetical protein DFJ43DRAFT_1148879 [Lentinula guzmanii]